MKIQNKIESIKFIVDKGLNRFPEKIFHTGEEDEVLEFIGKYPAEYYAIRDKSNSGGIFKLGVKAKDVLNEIKCYELFTINVSSLNYGDNQLLVGEIMITEDNDVWATLSKKSGASVRDALREPDYNIKTDIFDKRVLDKIENFNIIYDYIISNNLKGYIIEFTLFDIPVGIKNENIIIYEIRTDY